MFQRHFTNQKSKENKIANKGRHIANVVAKKDYSNILDVSDLGNFVENSINCTRFYEEIVNF